MALLKSECISWGSLEGDDFRWLVRTDGNEGRNWTVYRVDGQSDFFQSQDGPALAST
jgi:hypothetical protein